MGLHMIAIYGKFKDQLDARPIDPCGAGASARRPSCKDVATALGVRYEPNAADKALSEAQKAQPQLAREDAPPTADPQAAPADDDFVGSRPSVVMTSWIHTRGSSLFRYM